MALPKTKTFISPEEYLRIERAAGWKSEFFAGEMFAMAGGSVEHSLITANVIRDLGNQLADSPCVTHDSNLRIDISASDLYTYPDASVICGPAERSPRGGDMVTNPTLLVEVLSDSTEAYDRGAKFLLYRTLPSFVEYVLVSQKLPLVEVFYRQPDGTWRLTSVRGLEGIVPLDSLGVKLRMADVYHRVEFIEPPPLKSSAA